MSRIHFPIKFVQKTTLFGNILSKHTTDGAASVLTAFLVQNNIDLTADATAVSAAQTHETNRLSLTKQSGNDYQLCRLNIKTPFKNCKAEVQFLKSFYKDNFKALGDWGVSITDTGKINYPTGVAEKITLFNNIMQQHATYPAGQSPLQAYLSQNNIDLAADIAAAATAQDYYTKYLSAAKSAEEETQQRDRLMNPVNKHIHSIGRFLKNLFNPNTKSLGDWGFVVDDSKPKPKWRTSTLKIGSQKMVHPIVIGSVFINLGTGDLHVYKGKHTSGNPFIVAAGEQLAMAKGFSTITVVNPSTLTPGKFKVMITK